MVSIPHIIHQTWQSVFLSQKLLNWHRDYILSSPNQTKSVGPFFKFVIWSIETVCWKTPQRAVWARVCCFRYNLSFIAWQLVIWLSLLHFGVPVSLKQQSHSVNVCVNLTLAVSRHGAVTLLLNIQYVAPTTHVCTVNPALLRGLHGRTVPQCKMFTLHNTWMWLARCPLIAGCHGDDPAAP